MDFTVGDSNAVDSRRRGEDSTRNVNGGDYSGNNLNVTPVREALLIVF